MSNIDLDNLVDLLDPLTWDSEAEADYDEEIENLLRVDTQQPRENFIVRQYRDVLAED